MAIYENKLRHWMRDKDTKIAEGDFGDDNPFVMIIKNANNNVDVFANGGVESGSGSVVVATPADAENIIGNQSSPTQPLDGEIKEIIIFDSTLDDQENYRYTKLPLNKWNLRQPLIVTETVIQMQLKRAWELVQSIQVTSQVIFHQFLLMPSCGLIRRILMVRGMLT